MPRPLPEVDRCYTGPRPPMSIVILTLNEADNIGPCLESCAWCDDVHLLDSGSADGTVERAAAGGARVHFNAFKGFGQQRNWAIDNIRTKHDWVFHLDADERFTPQILAEIHALLTANPPPSHAGFLVANQMILSGAWIKRSSGYPAYQLRLFHRERLRFADSGHGQREVTSGTIGTLTHPYVHYNFSKGLEEWLARHNRYSSKEAAEIIAMRREPMQLADLLKGGMSRRRALKRLFARLPFRSQIRFWHSLLIDRGIFDGFAGLQYARLLAVYEQMIAIKVRDALRTGNKP
jgi:glycosyltransferase involved in cell wall biosynthesis